MKKKLIKYPVRANDVPVTKAMLYEVRNELKSDFNRLESRVSSDIHSIKLLIEEQNARNIFVLDGLNTLFHRQERVEDSLSQRK